MKKIISILLFTLVMALPALAQKFTASVTRNKVAVGETFQLVFTLNTSGANFKAPNLNDFDVYSGPNQSQNMSFVNGVMTQSITLSYILAAKKEGKITIGAASVIANGTTLQSNPVTLEVTKGSGNPGGNQSTQNPSTPTNDNLADNLYVKTTVNKTKAYQGEQITISHKVYTRYQLRGFQDVKFPDYNGFWSQDMPMNNQQIQLTTENVDGVSFQVAELKRTFLFAQRSGKIEIEPVVVECVVRKQSKRRSNDPFEQFFGGGYEDVVYSLKSKSVTIEITALPEAGKPAGFSGAVGEYTMKAQLNKENVDANDGVNLTVTLSGKGNIRLVDPLKIAFPEDFETYDPKTNENISIGGNGVSGTKTFDYLIIPRHEGDYTLDKLSFSYFDPGKAEYIVLPSPEFKLHVNKASGESAKVMSNLPRKEEVKVLGNDIRYIKTKNSELRSKDQHIFGSALFYTGIISPFLAFIGFLFFRKKNIEQNKDAVAVKSRKATKMARKRLSIAEQHLRSGNKELFYVEIFKALYGFIGDKLNLPVSDLNKEHITNKLKEKGVQDTTVSNLMTTIDTCEFARYAPSAVSGDLNSIYTNTVELITKIENEIR